MTIGQSPRAGINRPLAQLDESEHAEVSFPLAMSEMAQLMVGDAQDNMIPTHCRRYCHADNGAGKLGCFHNCYVADLLISTSVIFRWNQRGCTHMGIWGKQVSVLHLSAITL